MFGVTLQHFVVYMSVLSMKPIDFFHCSTLTEALERGKRKYQSRIKRLEQQLMTNKMMTATTTTTTNQALNQPIKSTTSETNDQTVIANGKRQ